MPTDNPLFIIPFSTGLIFVVVSLFMLKFPPKDINGLYGYRTASSMKNQERWDFAQIYASKLMIRVGAVLSASSLVGLIYKPTEDLATALGMGLMILAIIVLIIKVEMKLKSKFSKKE